ncbi:MAG TPA: hypothetical protein VET88_05950, partial [Gammaproteobacteria bacterium]|nr:hypothetical protein [Gammaproteobacteria bacterium]
MAEHTLILVPEIRFQQLRKFKDLFWTSGQGRIPERASVAIAVAKYPHWWRFPAGLSCSLEPAAGFPGSLPGRGR